jgi:2-haloacid dehalogenase
VSRRYDAVVCDLLSALLDSWALWRHVAGGQEEGRRWRVAYLGRVSAGEPYRPFLDVVAEAAADVGLDPALAAELGRRWDELEPWPEVPDVLGAVDVPIAVVTNCSEELGRRAAARLGVELAVVASTERAGHYKPHPETYGLALRELGVAPERALYVAGAPYDVHGAHAAGMQVLWHDRAGLRGEDEVPALAVIDSLAPLLEHLDSPR